MSAGPFTILPTMFAVKRDGVPHLIVYPERGTRALKSAESLEAWATIHDRQSDAVRDSAIAASMFGWDKPVALAALTAITKAQAGTADDVTALFDRIAGKAVKS